jgi:hypothetical protein
MRKIIMFILLLISILFILPVIEGLESSNSHPMGTYDFLAPIPGGINLWSQDTINSFTDKYNSINELGAKDMLDSSTFTTSNQGRIFLSNVLEREAQYYIENGTFPINKYVYKYLQFNTFNGQKNKKNQSLYISNIGEMLPNRIIYSTFIAPDEMSVTPIPISYQIWKGTISNPSSNI